MNYFDKLPTITYNDNLVKNLLARARLSDSVRKQKTAFYPYTMDGADRIDNLSNLYYDNPGYSWLIWLTNNTVDPYFDLPLSEEDLFSHIVAKYGSFELAQRKIKLFRTNWYDNTDQELTVAQFDALASSYKKYYEPVLDNVLNVAKYVRKRRDETVATNKIVSAAISSVTGTFKVGEEIRVNGTNYAFCTYVSATALTLQHVVGTLSGTVTGQESGATATIPLRLVNDVLVPDVTPLKETLAAQDNSFWSPVTFLEYEQELNEAKKQIKLLDVRFASQADSDLRRVMLAR
jgi:hypothetical protein